MKAIERLYQYIDFKGVKAIPFEKKIGLSNGYLGKQLKRNADLGEGILIKIIENCPEINPEWLLTGKGKMFKEEKNTAYKIDDGISNITKEPMSVPAAIDNNNEILDLLKDKITLLEETKAMQAKEIGRLELDIVGLKKNITSLQNTITDLKSNSQNVENTPSTPDASVLPLPISKSSKSQSRLRK